MRMRNSVPPPNYSTQPCWLALIHQICVRCVTGADGFHFSLCVSYHQVRCTAYLLRSSSDSPDPSRQMRRTSISGRPEPWRSSSAEFSTEQTGSHSPKQQDNIQSLFKIKHMLAPVQKSKKDTNTSSSADPWVGNSLCCCFYTYNCSCEWLLWELLCLAKPVVSTAPWRTQHAAGGGGWMAEGGAKSYQSFNAAAWENNKILYAKDLIWYSKFIYLIHLMFYRNCRTFGYIFVHDFQIEISP